VHSYYFVGILSHFDTYKRRNIDEDLFGSDFGFWSFIALILMQVLRRNQKNIRDSSFFTRFCDDKTSQGGEDGVIREVLSRLFRSDGLPRTLVEVGSWDGKHLSNTYSLLSTGTWKGLLLEANPARSEQARVMYEKMGLQDQVRCKTAFVSFRESHTGESLTNIVQKEGEFIPLDFDVLIVDVDGVDYHLWESFLEGSQFRPKMVVIEFNPTAGNDVVFIQEPNIKVQQGSSLRAITELALAHNYILVCATAFNAFFVTYECMKEGKFDDFLEHTPPAAALVSALAEKTSYRELLRGNLLHDLLHQMRSSSMVTELLQTYDGELHYVGPTKLLWHRKALNPQHLQVLKKSSRGFPFAPRLNGGIGGIGGAVDPAPNAPASVLESISGQAHLDAVSVANELFERLQKDGGTPGVRGGLTSFVESSLRSSSLDDLAVEVATSSLFCMLCSPWPSNTSKSHMSQRLRGALFHDSVLGSGAGDSFREYAVGIVEVMRSRAMSLLGGDSRVAFERADNLLTFAANVTRLQHNIDGTLVFRDEPALSADFLLQQARAARLTEQYMKAVLVIQRIFMRDAKTLEVNREANRLCEKIASECLLLSPTRPLKPTSATATAAHV
jgi:hypothetical protein